jgi:hypothetical protein
MPKDHEELALPEAESVGYLRRLCSFQRETGGLPEHLDDL